MFLLTCKLNLLKREENTTDYSSQFFFRPKNYRQTLRKKETILTQPCDFCFQISQVLKKIIVVQHFENLKRPEQVQILVDFIVTFELVRKLTQPDKLLGSDKNHIKL